MPVLLLFRDRPLNEDEIQRLPQGCFPVSGDAQRVVARADVRGSVPMLLFMVAKMVKAVPDADFGYEEGFGDEEESAEDSSDWTSASEEDSESDFQREEKSSAWRGLLESGQIDEAVESFLQEDGKLTLKITQMFLSSQQSHKIIFICKVACR